MSRPGRRRPAFNPDGLDDLNDVLAPPPPPPPPPLRPAPPEDEQSDSGELHPPTDGEKVETADRTTASAPGTPLDRSGASAGGGRTVVGSARRGAPSRLSPPATGRQIKSLRGRIATSVRVPANLYREVNETLLSGPERPSYGQLVMWSVEDYPADVIAAVVAALPDPSDRSPRGRRLAQDRVPVGLQLLAAERDQLDGVAAAAALEASATRGGEAPTVTRTAVAIAALEVALRSRRPRPPAD